MAFSRNQLRLLAGKADGIQIWGYETDDAIGVFSAAGYFPYDSGIKAGDHVMISLYADVTAKTAGCTGAYHLVISNSTEAADARANVDVDVTVA